MEEFEPDPDDCVPLRWSCAMIAGPPTVEQSTKNVNKARRYCAPPASRWKSSATTMCHVSALLAAKYCVNQPIAPATLDQQYDAEDMPNVPTVFMKTSPPRSN